MIPGCSPSWEKMEVVNGKPDGILKFKPRYQVAMYNTRVDVAGNHLSGILVIKKMPDSSTRMVFSNEIGFKFFDFEFSPFGVFKVYSIIPQMNKKSVVRTLRKDFELVLMINTEQPLTIRKSDQLLYHIFPEEKGYNYYITDSLGKNLVRIERASKRKTVVKAIMNYSNNGIPDSIGISHTNFNFTIGLKRIERDTTQ